MHRTAMAVLDALGDDFVLLTRRGWQGERRLACG